MKLFIASALAATVLGGTCPEMDVNFYNDRYCTEDFSADGISEKKIVQAEKEMEEEINGMLQALGSCNKIAGGFDTYGIIECDGNVVCGTEYRDSGCTQAIAGKKWCEEIGNCERNSGAYMRITPID